MGANSFRELASIPACNRTLCRPVDVGTVDLPCAADTVRAHDGLAVAGVLSAGEMEG